MNNTWEVLQCTWPKKMTLQDILEKQTFEIWSTLDLLTILNDKLSPVLDDLTEGVGIGEELSSSKLIDIIDYNNDRIRYINMELKGIIERLNLK